MHIRPLIDPELLPELDIFAPVNGPAA